MNESKVLITKKFEFSASHRYWREEWSEEKNQQVFGICTSPYGHGHNYELHVTVTGLVDTTTGMIINLTDLKKHVSAVVAGFDHKYLNLDTPYFKEDIPTTENIARLLFTLIDKELNGKGEFRLARIRLYERSDLYVDVSRRGQ
ncbi:MAG: 6-carboxytetrahydropterin synthase [Calditrichales bacterium]|nr:MAG: 6-carboxytetrahydropterin synthase [Calditrichales bacterium]